MAVRFLQSPHRGPAGWAQPRNTRALKFAGPIIGDRAVRQMHLSDSVSKDFMAGGGTLKKTQKEVVGRSLSRQ